MAQSTKREVLDLVAEAGVLRPRDLDRHGIPRAYLQRLLRDGEVERVGRGLYMLPGADVTEHHTLVEASKRVPHGVVCLLSALRFHELGTQNPFEVWMALEQKAWRPRGVGIPLRVFYLSKRAFEAGVQVHRIEGVTVRVYSPAKTVADCFKFRNKIGLEVSLEALRDYRRSHRAGLDELWSYARVCRVSEVMRPYLEALQ